MTTTNQFPFVVVKNGTTYRLDTLAYNISSRNGRLGTAGVRGAPVEVVGRDGSIYVPGRSRTEGLSVLSMWVHSTDVNGALVPGEDPYTTWKRNLDFLLWLFDTTAGQIEIREYTLPSSDAQLNTASRYVRMFCEVRQVILPTIKGRVFGELAIQLVINSVYREDGALQTSTSVTGTGAVGTFSLAEFDGATAPMKDLVLCLDGPLTNPAYIDVATGHKVWLAATVPSGQQWTLNCSTLESRVGAGLDFSTSSGTRKTSTTFATGCWLPNLFALTPAPGGPSIQLTGSAASTTTRFRVQGRRKYH